jgi:hypothetical protein
MTAPPPSLQSGVESNAAHGDATVDVHAGAVRPAGMAPVADPCETCPIRRAALIHASDGVDAETHFLRVQVVELNHKLGLVRAELRRRGIDPDIAYHPHDADPTR